MNHDHIWKLQENVIGEEDIDLLVDFIRHTKRFTQFEKVREFEAAYSSWQGCPFSVYVNSGSSANLLMIYAAMEKYGWEPGDEVLVPALTWPTTVTPVIQAGLKPVFVDANLDDLSFDYDQLADSITDRTRAIFVAHILGFPADIPRIRSLIGDRPITLLEDCCETQGGTIDGIKVGNFGLASSFSFYWGHHMTTVEGGMICTHDEAFYRSLVLKRSHGLARELPPHYHEEIQRSHSDIPFQFLFLTDGFNVRNTEFNAVLGLAQLPKLDSFIEIRNRNYRRFHSLCTRFHDHLLALDHPGLSSFVLPFLFRKREDKEALEPVLNQAGIESRPLISGNLLRQPFLKSYYQAERFPHADFCHDHGFYIGNNQFVDDARMDVLEETMVQFFRL
jgi:CDP-6-deoxy-D-xylo-4-hexulose-3-dehydrase